MPPILLVLLLLLLSEIPVNLPGVQPQAIPTPPSNRCSISKFRAWRQRISQQQNQIEILTAQIEEQIAQIQQSECPPRNEEASGKDHCQRNPKLFLERDSRKGQEMKRNKSMKTKYDITGQPDRVSCFYAVTRSAGGHSLRRTGAFRISRPRKAAMRLVLSLLALEIQDSVGVHSLPIAPATSIPALAPERWC